MAVYSITFKSSDTTGYLNKIRYKEVLKKGFTDEDYQNALKDPQRYRRYSRDIKSYFYKDVADGYQNILARYCLIDRKIEFSTDKINLIYGPNASGKSTIIKTIASHALCGDTHHFDGFTSYNTFEPFCFPWSDDSFETKYNMETFKRLIYEKAGNDADIEWDGHPVYYHNFANSTNTGTIDDYVGGNLLGGLGENLVYLAYKNKMNDGKKSLYILSHLYNIATQNLDIQDIISNAEKAGSNSNDVWKRCYDLHIEYLNSHMDTNAPHQNTILLDEIDKSLDVFSIAQVFKKCLPEILKINNTQIIVISHSPLVLSPDICNPDIYNTISMNEDYTNEVKELFGKINF